MQLISKTYWLGMPFWYRGALPDGTAVEPVHLRAQDYRHCQGLFHTPADVAKRKRVAVLVMHPRADFSRHYCIPGLVRAGISVLGLGTRCLNNDVTAIHEDLVLDVAAGVAFLRERGFEKVVLFGNSGGGSLFALYQAQASAPGSERIARDPSGKPTKLRGATLVPADGFLAVSAHAGEGKILMHMIDPAVTDERDPLVSDPALDMYDVRNGFAEPPAPSRYAPDFLARYREAQVARVARIDAHARALIREAREAERVHETSGASLPFEARQRIGRRASFEPVLTIYRTMANPAYVDPTLDPSRRGYGSLFSERPDLMNYQYIGFGRLVTAPAWLSTWSGLSSNADFTKNVGCFETPILFVNALRDKEIFPSEARAMADASRSPDKTFLELDAEHYFEPPFGQEHAPDVDTLMAHVVPWIDARFA